MLLIELLDYAFTESKTDTPIIVSILLDSSLRIRPQQVAQQSRIWHICWSHDILDLLQILELWTQASMHAKNLLINQCCNGQGVENITENFPKSDGVASLALIIESIDTIDLGTLVIASQQEKVLWVFNLVGEQ